MRYAVTDMGAVTPAAVRDSNDGNFPQYRDGRAPHFDAAGLVTFGTALPSNFREDPTFHGPVPPQLAVDGYNPTTYFTTASAGQYSAGVVSGPINRQEYDTFISDGSTSRLLFSGSPLFTFGANGINRGGQMISGSVGGSSLYDFRTGTTTVSPGIDSLVYSSVALGMNNLGQVVGRSHYSIYQLTDDTHAWLALTPGVGLPTDLNDLIDPKSGWLLQSASGIADDGRIVGVGLDGQGRGHYFLLTPQSVPEPATIALVGAGSLLLIRRRRKEKGAE
ncbi:MAG: putative exosortase interaction proteinHAF family repeat protein [Planctomycetota bacterium]|nr:putative exosortase interaction proteinHAF family repeat protein [Planctomycetota bacterium]